MGPAAPRHSSAPGLTAPRLPVRAFALGRLLEEAAWWLLLVSALLIGVRAGAQPQHVGLALAALLLLRPPLMLVGRLIHPLLGYAALLLVIAGALVLSLLGLLDGFALVLAFALAVGGVRALGAAQRAQAMSRAFGDQARAVAATDERVSWLGMALGAALAAGIHWLLFVAQPIVFGALAAVVGLTLARAALFDVPSSPEPLIRAPAHAPTSRASSADRPAVRPPGSRPPASLPGPAVASFRPLVRSRLATHAAAAFSSGALFVALIALLPFLGAAMEAGPELAGLGLTLIGGGGLLLRLPVRRVRQRVPPVLLVAGLVWALAVAVGLIGLAGWWLPAMPLLALAGGLAASLQHEQALRVRQAGEAAPTALTVLLPALALGQLAGALVVAVIGSGPAALGGTLALLAVGAAGVMGAALIVDRRSLFAHRAQVQQFSWDAAPPPRPYEPARPGTRRARLEAWVGRQVEIELVDVTLPVSGRHYAIARPSGDGRDRLFEVAKADPERQMPYWAKVWPSGVALADVVVERADEVREVQALELGAGLGVTACTVLEEGGRLVTADYPLLPLALCRLNGLGNTGRAPGSICFNWRNEAQVNAVLRRHPPIGLMLAADVLYEGRDVMPLVQVIERLLAPAGALWLAEPVRRTAQRFLDTVAARGWSIDSRTIAAEWPDATDGRVNVHIIRREQEPAEAAVGPGGWHI